MRFQYSSVTVSFLIHSTEEPDRLESAVAGALGLEITEIEVEKIDGHYGNELLLAKAHITGDRANHVVDNIAKHLTEASRKDIASKLENSMDEHDALYLRLDRQTLAQGLSTSDDEPIRIKIKPKSRFGGRVSMKSAFVEELKLR